jgi:hypothetical protein
VQLHGDVLGRLDDGGVVAVLGHEIGHHLAHGPHSLRGVDPFFLYWRLMRGRRAGYRELAAAYCRAAELTADRFGLLACRDLAAVVRMEAAVRRPDGGGVDAGAQLAQCVRYAEGLLRERRRARGDSHPEGAVRAYAAWLFSESDAYRELTGRGPGTRPIADVDRALARLVGPSESAEDMGLPPHEPPLAERARDALAVARERARARASAAAQRVVAMALLATGAHGAGAHGAASGAGGVDGIDGVDLSEGERDPLEERFRSLERRAVRESLAEAGRRPSGVDSELERRFVELERCGDGTSG